MRPSRIAVQIASALTIVLGVAAVVAALFLIRLAPDRRTDFAIFYRSALAWRQGGTLYPTDRVNLNPPAVVVAYAPLTYVSSQTAQMIFTLLGVACVLASSRWITKTIPRTQWLVLASIVLAIDAGWINLWLEQEGLILMLVVTAAWIADREHRDLSAGAWAGLAIYAKPFLAVLIFYWAWRGRWRRIGATLAAAVVLTLAGAALAGPASYISWWHSLGLGPAPYAPLNASLLGLWSRAFFGSEFAPALIRQPLPVLLTAWGLSLVALVWTIAWRVAADRDDVDRAWALVLIGSLLASPLGWIYYLPIVAGPLLGCIGGFISWMCVWVSLAILLICRSEVLIALHTSAVGAIVLGSIHVWVLLLLFLAAVSGAPESQTWVGTLSEGRTRDAGLSDETVAVAPRSS
jgi:alpha-1,2-mannosyltransferase